MQEHHTWTVGRTENLRQLKHALDERPLVYLGGSFGSGKTTLMAQLAATFPDALTLSCRDNDLIEKAKGLSAPLLLIDDTQELNDPIEQTRLLRILGGLPVGSKAVLAGWSPMPGWLSALYAAGHLTVLGQDFLNFSREEAEQFLVGRGLHPEPRMIDQFMVISHGWAIVLSLYTVRLQETPDITMEALQALMEHDLFECLESVVYITFDPVTRNLLNHMALFEHFTVGMARFVSGVRNAGDVLNKLCQSCGFLHFVPPDQYVFSPLFRKFLLHRLESVATEDFSTQQYNNAGLYYELEDSLPEALQAYRQAGNIGKLSELLIVNAGCKPDAGNYLDLKEYFDMLSEETLAASPELMCGMSMLHSLTMNVSESERWFRLLTDFAARTPRRNPQWLTAQESIAYLSIALPHRGVAHMPAIMSSCAKAMLIPGFHMHEFNVAGNSPSLMAGARISALGSRTCGCFTPCWARCSPRCLDHRASVCRTLRWGRGFLKQA